MKNLISIMVALCAVGTIASNAHAEDVSLHLSGGAINVVSDKSVPLNPGMAGDVKVLFALNPNLTLGPVVASAYMPQTDHNLRGTTSWGFGLAMRLQGARDTVSPYVEVAGLANESSLVWNPATSVSLGLDVPLEQTNTFFAGPYVSWGHIFNADHSTADQTLLVNNADVNMVTVGLSLSFDAPVKPRVVEVPVVQEKVVVVERRTTVMVPGPVEHQMLAKPLQLTQHAQFAKGSAELTNETQTMLHGLARQVNSDIRLRVEVVGSASADGNAAFNLTLSKQRANAVVEYLVNDCTVSRDRLSSVGTGAVGDLNDTSNRSVTFVVLTE